MLQGTFISGNSNYGPEKKEISFDSDYFLTKEKLTYFDIIVLTLLGVYKSRVPARLIFVGHLKGTYFDVLLTLHLSTISVINQLNEQILVL